ncbi:MAG: glycosyltransferase [Bryobacteraceae bacterium]|nr:glycosyltransferase [Bryobacteraceae bacterium]
MSMPGRPTAVVVANSRLKSDIGSRQWYQRDFEALTRLGFDVRIVADFRKLGLADLYLSWWAARSAPVVALAHLLGRRCIVVAGGTDSIRSCPALVQHPFFYGSKPLLVRALTRFALRYAHAVIAVSSSTVPDLTELGARQVSVIHNCIDTDVFAPPGTAPAAPSPDLVTVCNMDRHACVLKGLDILLETTAILAAEFPDVRLRIIGTQDGGCEDVLACATRIGIRHRLLFSGRLPNAEVAAWMRRSSIFVTASHYETFGVAVAEAMAVGLPVVAPRLPALLEVAGTEVGLVERNEPSLLAARVAEILRRPTLYRRMSEHGRQRVLSEFSFDGRTLRLKRLLADMGCLPERR